MENLLCPFFKGLLLQKYTFQSYGYCASLDVIASFTLIKSFMKLSELSRELQSVHNNIVLSTIFQFQRAKPQILHYRVVILTFCMSSHIT